MTGLEKITGKILAEAQADADRTIAEAKEKCDAITAEYQAQAERIKERIRADAQREGEGIVTRAKSGAAMDQRNILLSARADLIDETFDEAYETLKALPADEYVGLLVKLLADALISCVTEQKTNLALYGEEEVTSEPERYEVIFNASDREKLGRQVLAGVRRAVVGKLEPAVLEKLVLSDRAARIDGGVILKYGDVESNCSLEMVFADARDRLEADVSRMLFD